MGDAERRGSAQIIEVDGVNHEALEVDQIQIFAGQRYSVIVNANQTIDNYCKCINPSATMKTYLTLTRGIRADPNNGNTGTDLGLNSAILRYVGANATDPTTTQDNSTNPLVESNLVASSFHIDRLFPRKVT
jgi:iron transport multicopper oxidase